MQFVIAGGGISGLAAAAALRSLPDCHITVLERSPQLSEIGAAIQLKPNATRWLSTLGINVPALRGVTVQRVVQYSHQNEKIMQQTIAATKMFGSPWLLTHRADLHAELQVAATKFDPKRPEFTDSSSSVKIVTGVKVVGVDHVNGTVFAEDGRSWSGDVVIAADGIHSAVRSAVFPDAKSPTPAHQAAYRALVPTKALACIPTLSELGDVEKAGMVVWIGEDRRVVTYPCRDLEYINIVAIFPDPALCPDQSAAAEAHMPSQTVKARRSWPRPFHRSSTVEEMKADFKHFPEPVVQLLGLAETASLWQLRDLDCNPTWTTGRVVLIGDAAHAMLPHMGQGGSTSIEDAAALLHIFQSYPGQSTSLDSVSHILSAFEKLRLERVHTIQSYSRIQGQPKADETSGHHMNALQFSRFAFGNPGFSLEAEA